MCFDETIPASEGDRGRDTKKCVNLQFIFVEAQPIDFQFPRLLFKSEKSGMQTLFEYTPRNQRVQ